jgi:hypothetical protein
VIYHLVTGVVSTSLDRAAADIVPASLLQALRSRLQANAVRNLYLMRELLSLIKELDARGIAVIPFKGPVLATTAYGNLALREFGDLDILVPKRDIFRAGELLAQRGYRQPAEQNGEASVKHVESQLGWDFTNGRVSIELHWSFLQKWLGFEVDLDALWKSPLRVVLGGTEVRTLSTEVALLYLCAHGAKHHWGRLCWILDIANILRTQRDIAWTDLLATAKRDG